MKHVKITRSFMKGGYKDNREKTVEITDDTTKTLCNAICDLAFSRWVEFENDGVGQFYDGFYTFEITDDVFDKYKDDLLNNPLVVVCGYKS